MRKEHDFLGEKLVPDEVYYGVQTMRAKENFQITGAHLDPDFIKAMATVKKASCLTNMKTGRMDETIGSAIVKMIEENAGRPDLIPLVSSFAGKLKKALSNGIGT